MWIRSGVAMLAWVGAGLLSPAAAATPDEVREAIARAMAPHVVTEFHEQCQGDGRVRPTLIYSDRPWRSLATAVAAVGAASALDVSTVSSDRCDPAAYPVDRAYSLMSDRSIVETGPIPLR